MRLLEVAVFNFESAVVANDAGADRIEICENYEMGGYTPSFDYVRKSRELGGIDVFVMIRQKAEDFNYTRKDLDIMLKDVEVFKGMNVNGFVFGGLDKNKSVNTFYSKEIIEAANPLPVTFHRAFDMCENLDKAIEDIISCGFRRILTSGGKLNAYDGRFVIKDLIKKYGKEIIFIPGGGIRSNNLSEIERTTMATEFHTAGIMDNQKEINPRIYVEDIVNIKNS